MTHKLFSNYDGALPTLDGFVDDSWQHDACPSMFNTKRGLKLWVDYVDPNLRECSGAGKRYTLCIAEDSIELLTTDSLSEIQEYLK